MKGCHSRKATEGTLMNTYWPASAKKPFLLIWILIGPGGMLHHFDDNHTAQTANEPNDALNDVDDQTTQHVFP